MIIQQAPRPRLTQGEFVVLAILGSTLVAVATGYQQVAVQNSGAAAQVDNALQGLAWLYAYGGAWLHPLLSVALIVLARRRPDNNRLARAAFVVTFGGVWVAFVVAIVILNIAASASPLAVITLAVPGVGAIGYLVLANACSRSTADGAGWRRYVGELLHGTRSERATIVGVLGLALASASIVGGWAAYGYGNPFGPALVGLSGIVHFGLALGADADPVVSAYAPTAATGIALAVIVLGLPGLRRGWRGTVARAIALPLAVAGVVGHLRTHAWVGRIPNGSLVAPDHQEWTVNPYPIFSAIIGSAGFVLVVVGLLWPSRRQTATPLPNHDAVATVS